MELVWYRMLAPLLGGSTYTFGLILAIALAGIGAGSAVYWLAGRGKPPTLSGFAATCALEALCLGVPYALGDRLALFAALLRPIGAFGFGGYVAGWSLVAGIVDLPRGLRRGAAVSIAHRAAGAGARAGRRGRRKRVRLEHAGGDRGIARRRIRPAPSPLRDRNLGLRRRSPVRARSRRALLLLLPAEEGRGGRHPAGGGACNRRGRRVPPAAGRNRPHRRLAAQPGRRRARGPGQALAQHAQRLAAAAAGASWPGRRTAWNRAWRSSRRATDTPS